MKYKPTMMAKQALETILCNAVSSLDSSLGCRYPITNPLYSRYELAEY